MRKKILPFITLFISAAPAFSKGRPVAIQVNYQDQEILFYTSGTYLLNGQPAHYTYTHTLEIDPLDSVQIVSGGTSTGWVDYLRVYRNDTLVYGKNGNALNMQTWVSQPGRYLVQSHNPSYPEQNLTFYITHKMLVVESEMPAEFPETISVYPNPSLNGFALHAAQYDLDGKLNVVDIQGKQVLNNDVFHLGAGSEYYIPTNGWQAGVYILQLNTARGIQRFRIIKNT